MGSLHIDDADWQFTSPPSEKLESHLYANGLTVMYEDGQIFLEGGSSDLHRLPADLLEEVAGISADFGWLLWWNDDDLAADQFHLTVTVAGAVTDLVLPRPRDLYWMRRAWNAEQALRRIGHGDEA